MCDTFAVRVDGGTIFAKNSDRPVDEAQVIAYEVARPARGRLDTQYLHLPSDPGSNGALFSRPDWLWGAETAVSSSRVAIGNERVFTTDDPTEAPAALIGMDLVRLAAERAAGAEHGVKLIGRLLALYGQGGGCLAPGEDGAPGDPYWSSFLIVDPRETWQMETSGRAWVAARSESGGAISNRLSDRTDWDLSGGGADPATWPERRDPTIPTVVADDRLAVTEEFASSKQEGGTAGIDAAIRRLRSHGGTAWGAPPDTGTPEAIPPIGDDLGGLTVCMHLSGAERTTSSMVSWLPESIDERPLTFAAVGAPCCSVYLPCGVGWVPGVLSDPRTSRAVGSLAAHVESNPEALADVRATLDPVEAEIREQAAKRPGRPPFDGGQAWSAMVVDALKSLRREFGLSGT